MFKQLKQLLAGSLRRQLIVGMALVMAVTMSLFTWDQIRRQQTLLLAEQTEMAKEFAFSIATSSAVWLASQDYAGLQDIVDSVKHYSDMQHTIVLDARGRILAHSDLSHRGKYLRDLPKEAKPQVLHNGTDLVDVVSPVMLAGQHIGWVRVGLARNSMNFKLAELKRGSLIFSLSAIAISILLALLTGHYLTRRLYAIKKVADAVQAGDSQLRADVSGDDEAAQLAHQFNTMLDTLAQRKAALKQSERLYRSLVENASDAIFISDVQGRIILANSRASDLFGYLPEEFTGKPAAMITCEADKARQRTEFESMVNGERVLSERQFQRKNGTLFAGEISACRLEGDWVLGIVRDITERKQSQADQSIAAVAFQSQEGFVVTDSANVILRINKAFTEITGYTALDAVGKKMNFLKSHRHDARFYDTMWEQILRDGFWTGEIWNRLKNSEIRLHLITISAVKDRGDSISHYVGSYVDITERKQAEKAITDANAELALQSEEKDSRAAELLKLSSILSTIIENFPGGISMFDVDLRLTGYNELFKKILDLPDSLFENSKLFFEDIIRFNAQRGEYGPCDVEQYVADSVARARSFQAHKFERKRSNGTVIEIEGKPVPGGGFQTIYMDITERKQMEEQIRQLAFHDPLTQLPNRRLLHDRLSQALAASQRSGDYCALMFLDLDNFKPLNDAHGHVVGDLLLIDVANRLKSCVRATDTVARFGGDEFVVLLSALKENEVESKAQAQAVAEKIRALLAEPYLLTLNHADGSATLVEHRCSASIGVTLTVLNETSEVEVLKRADAAMYQAKEAGRNAIYFA